MRHAFGRTIGLYALALAVTTPVVAVVVCLGLPPVHEIIIASVLLTMWSEVLFVPSLILLLLAPLVEVKGNRVRWWHRWAAIVSGTYLMTLLAPLVLSSVLFAAFPGLINPLNQSLDFVDDYVVFGAMAVSVLVWVPVFFRLSRGAGPREWTEVIGLLLFVASLAGLLVGVGAYALRGTADAAMTIHASVPILLLSFGPQVYCFLTTIGERTLR